MIVQLDLFTWARDLALAEATAATERATPLRGAARNAVEPSGS